MIRFAAVGLFSLIIFSIIFKLAFKLLVPIAIIFGGIWLVRRVLRRARS